jgi:hypothetical protein
MTFPLFIPIYTILLPFITMATPCMSHSNTFSFLLFLFFLFFLVYIIQGPSKKDVGVQQYFANQMERDGNDLSGMRERSRDRSKELSNGDEVFKTNQTDSSKNSLKTRHPSPSSFTFFSLGGLLVR